MAQATVAAPSPIDHAALDTIMTRLESRYGHDPRVDRAFRLFMGEKVELSAIEPTTALVHGDSGRSYWATVDGWCECPDHANGHTCKHSLAVKIACQMAAVMRAHQHQDEPQGDVRALYIRLCQEQQKRGRLLSAQGIRPIEDPVWVQADEQIQRVKRQLPTATLVR